VRLRRKEIVCRQAVELVTDYLEGVLTRPERARFEHHLRRCTHCHEYLEQIRLTIQVLGHVEPDALEPHVKTELIDLYRGWQAG
jgi:predicted anti-sigma-YlaC factor YlaD